MFVTQATDGSFPLALFRPDDRFQMIPMQTALPLRGLAMVGYAADDRAERAYDWLLAQRMGDGSWPTGIAAGQPGYVAGYRKLPGSRGCRANTQAALACLALHPDRCRDDAARRGVDLLLRRETRDEWAIGTETSRLLGADPATGFISFYARFDLAFVLDIASCIGVSLEDARIADLVGFLVNQRGTEGLWEHPEHPELSRWLTMSIRLSLRRLEHGNWAGTGPRLAFQATRRHRY